MRNTFQMGHPMLGKPTRPGAVSKKREITQRGPAVTVVAVGDIGDHVKGVAICVVGAE
jgi:hypothetical protein